MMKSTMLILGFIVTFSTFVEARNFYRTSFEFWASYTHIHTGSKSLFSDNVQIVYSDDSAFCYFQYNNTEISCTLLKLSDSRNPTVALPLSFIKNLFIIASEKEGRITTEEKAAVRRLISLFPESLQISPSSGRKAYQLHDQQPEAIHVTVDELEYGRPY